MSRIKSVVPEATTGPVAGVLQAQARHWGAPLANHLVYAQRPQLFKAVRGMWGAINADGILDTALVHLVNRRVAALNRCSF